MNDKIINIITFICLILLVIQIVYFGYNLLVKTRNDRTKRIKFIRSFKKGKFAMIYFIAIPLYMLAYFYNNYETITFLEAFFKAMSKTVLLVVLRFEFPDILPLMNVNSFYEFTVYFCFTLVTINAILFSFSLFGQNIWHWFGVKIFKWSRKEKLIIIGNNEDNHNVYLSDIDRFSKILIDDFTNEDIDKLYFAKILYKQGFTIKFIDDILKKYKKTNIKIVINNYKTDLRYGKFYVEQDDEKNIKIANQIIDILNNYSNDDELLSKVNIYIFGDPKFESVYTEIMEKGFGTFTYINKYQKVAIDFINKFPLTKFMNEKQIDYNTTFIKPNIDINVILIGFGKANSQIFLTSVANNQFLTSDCNNKPVIKKVDYHIFDREKTENDKNLNHNYYRFKNEIELINKEHYLPLPDLPANEYFDKLDINDKNFYVDIKKILGKSKDNVNYIIIAFGSDLENIDLAQKLVQKKQEWEIENLNIFVKVRKSSNESKELTKYGCHYIGNEKDIVFNINNIINDKFYNMALMRDEVYGIEYKIKEEGLKLITNSILKENHLSVRYKWHIKKTQIERESNLYGCLSIRSKLNLLGFDCITKDEVLNNPNKYEVVSEEEYMKVYAVKDKLKVLDCDISIDDDAINPLEGKRIYDYPLVFLETKRKNLAILEHQRWNSFMISKGMIPSSIKQIESLNDKGECTKGKNYAFRRHGNITTFDGLITFRKLVSKITKDDERKTDVICYDYQILDDAYWLLNKNGYVIVKK